MRHDRHMQQSERAAQLTHLEVQVIDSSIGSQRVEAQSKVGVVRLLHKEQGQKHSGWICELWQVIMDARDEQHMPILNRRHVDEHHVCTWCDSGIWMVLDRPKAVTKLLKLEQHLRVKGLFEVELLRVKTLYHLQDKYMSAASSCTHEVSMQIKGNGGGTCHWI